MSESTESPAEYPVITSVFFFPNGMVAVCDQYGRQMPEYQGTCEEFQEKLAEAGDDLSSVREFIHYKHMTLEQFREEYST